MRQTDTVNFALILSVNNKHVLKNTDLEGAYILFSRYAELVVRRLPKYPQNKSSELRTKAQQLAPAIIEELEKLHQKLKNIFDEKLRKEMEKKEEENRRIQKQLEEKQEQLRQQQQQLEEKQQKQYLEDQAKQNQHNTSSNVNLPDLISFVNNIPNAPPMEETNLNVNVARDTDTNPFLAPTNPNFPQEIPNANLGISMTVDPFQTFLDPLGHTNKDGENNNNQKVYVDNKGMDLPMGWEQREDANGMSKQSKIRIFESFVTTANIIHRSKHLF